jgi:antitoxin HicB
MMRYAVRLIPDDNGTVRVEVPDLPGTNTFGEDAEDALGHAVDAIDSMLEFLMDDRRPIPRPKARGHYVALPPLKEAKLQLYELMRRRNVRKADLARMLDWRPMQVDRLFNLQHNSRIDQLQQAFAVLGKELVMTLEVRDAARPATT